jgi:hypothetical protein
VKACRKSCEFSCSISRATGLLTFFPKLQWFWWNDSADSHNDDSYRNYCQISSCKYWWAFTRQCFDHAVIPCDNDHVFNHHYYKSHLNNWKKDVVDNETLILLMVNMWVMTIVILLLLILIPVVLKIEIVMFLMNLMVCRNINIIWNTGTDKMSLIKL